MKPSSPRSPSASLLSSPRPSTASCAPISAWATTCSSPRKRRAILDSHPKAVATWRKIHVGLAVREHRRLTQAALPDRRHQALSAEVKAGPMHATPFLEAQARLERGNGGARRQPEKFGRGLWRNRRPANQSLSTTSTSRLLLPKRPPHKTPPPQQNGGSGCERTL